MKVGIIIFIVIVMVLSSSQFCSAFDGNLLSMEINQKTYMPGDNVVIKAVVINPFDYKVKADLTWIAKPSSQETPIAAEREVLFLEPNQRKDVVIKNFTVDLETISDSYNLLVELRIGDSLIDKEERLFNITGTLKTAELEIKVCKDEQCSKPSSMFKQNEDIYLFYDTNSENMQIAGKLTYSNKKTEQITLPYSFKAEQIGTYELEVTASKEGYKTINKKLQFGVIEKEADIQYSEPRIESNTNFTKGILYVSIGIIVFIILFWLYKRKQ